MEQTINTQPVNIYSDILLLFQIVVIKTSGISILPARLGCATQQISPSPTSLFTDKPRHAPTQSITL